jgi:hypothetical protein
MSRRVVLPLVREGVSMSFNSQREHTGAERVKSKNIDLNAAFIPLKTAFNFKHLAIQVTGQT